MRNRLVAAFVGLTVAVIALYGIPRAVYVQGLVESAQQTRVDRSAVFAAALADEALAHGDPVGPALFRGAAADGELISYRAPDGSVSVLVGDSAREGDRLSASRSLDNGGTITVSLSDAAVAGEVRAALLPLIALGLVLMPLSAFVGLLLARRLSNPFSELAELARELGTGRLDVQVPHYRIPEAEAIGQALEHSSERLDTLIRREREVAVHASHELRTPITALRLTLEDLALWPQTDAQVAEELHRIVAEIDRLSGAVTGLLEESRHNQMEDAELLDLGRVVTESLDRWEPVARAVNLSLRSAPSPVALHTQLPYAPVARAVDLLLKHALEVAEDDITVEWGDRGTHLAVEIGYASRADGEHSVVCAEVAELAASVGGRFATETGSDGSGITRLVLMLATPQAAQRIA